MIIKTTNKNLINLHLRKIYFEQHRYKRYLKQPKPLWKPVSVQKLFTILPVKKLSKEDQEELDKDEKIYAYKYKSIQKYFEKEITIPILQGGSDKELTDIKDKQNQLYEENNRENERIAKLREERLRLEKIEEEVINLKKKLQENEEYQVEKEQIISKIMKEKERYPTYITEDKLVKAIELALDHPTNYEYAIDLDGNVLFNKKLHPYAFEPSLEPDSDNITDDFILEGQNVQLKSKKLFYE